MQYSVNGSGAQSLIEGTRGQRSIARVDDVTHAIEACFEHRIRRLLLYAENLPIEFFDLSSGQAGVILQKLRTYNIRLAVVRSPSLRLSSRFGELLADESRGSYFALFDGRAEAQAWLCS